MKQLTTYNRVAGYLNHIFDLLNQHYFSKVNFPDPLSLSKAPPEPMVTSPCERIPGFLHWAAPMRSILELEPLIVPLKTSVPPSSMSSVTTMLMFMV